MADKTKIQWCDATWNPVTGCSPVSEGCANCYAARMASRFRQVHGGHFSQILMHPERLDQPLRWKKPRRIFVSSMGDLFHEGVSDAWFSRIISVIAAAQQHTFMVLTKRPEQMLLSIRRFYEFGRKTPILPNLWLGVTAENQEQANKRIPILLQIPAAKRFVSIEPMLGPVNLNDLTANLKPKCGRSLCDYFSALNGSEYDPQGNPKYCNPGTFNSLDWVIVGGETGPGARPMHPDWARSVRDQCQAAGVPFFFKSWGSHVPVTLKFADNSYPAMQRVKHGQSVSHRTLDGRTWEEFPA